MYCLGIAALTSVGLSRQARYSGRFSKALRIIPMARPNNSFSVVDLVWSGARAVASEWGTGTSSATLSDVLKPVSGSPPDLADGFECSTAFSGCGAVAVRGSTSFGSFALDFSGRRTFAFFGSWWRRCFLARVRSE